MTRRTRRENPHEYILLPSHGMGTPPRHPKLRPSGKSSDHWPSILPRLAEPPANRSYRILDSVDEDGAKLVEMFPEMAEAIRREKPTVRVLSLVYYQAADLRPAVLRRISDLSNRLGGEQSLVTVRVRGGSASPMRRSGC